MPHDFQSSLDSETLVTLEQKLWSRVKRGGSDQCWPWVGCRAGKGYGVLRFRGKNVLTHRVAALLAGKIENLAAPKSKRASGFVLHRCDNPPCCNPQHLFTGSYLDNTRDAISKNRKFVAGSGVSSPRSKLTSSEVKSVRELASAGWSLTRLSQRFRISRSTVSRVVRGEAYAGSTGPTLGPRGGVATLNPSAVAEIRHMCARGAASQRAIAEQFGISQITVSRIQRGLRYRT